MNYRQHIPEMFFRYDFQRIYSGIESKVYIGSYGDNKVILKHGPTKVKGYYIVEKNIYKELEKQGIKAPRFIFSNNDENILIISFMEGRELNNDYELFKRSSIWEDTAKDLSLLRNIACVGFGKIKGTSPEGIFEGTLNDWKALFDKTESFLSSLEITDVITSRPARKLRDYWSQNKNKISLETGFVVHGDFCMDHIWTFNREYAGLIDFGDAFIGDSLMDIAYFKLKEIDKDYGKRTFDNLYAPYSTLSGDDRSEENKKILINLYMIYWGVNRIIGISDENIKRRFGEKVKTLSEEL